MRLSGTCVAVASFLTASVFFLFEFVLRIEPSLATQEIADDLGLSLAGMGGLSSLFFWIYAPMQIVVGLLLDRYGARRFILPAILVCGLGACLFASVESPVLAGIGRFATGLGASFAFVGALYVVNHWFAKERFALLSGAVNALGMMGTAIGAVALTAAVETTGWRTVFLGTGIFGVGLFALALLVFRDAPVIEDMEVHESPLGPLHEIVREPQVWLIAIVGALVYMPINVFGGLWGHAELVRDHNLSSVGAETAVSMVFWGMAAGSIGAGALSDHIGHRKWIIFVGAAGGAVAWAAAIYADTNSETVLSVLLFLAGMLSATQMLTFAMARDGQSERVAGTTIAFVNMIGIGAALIFQPLVGWLVDYEGGSFLLAMMTVPASLALAAVLIVVALKEPDYPADSGGNG